jgi:hypothetical protein
LCCGQRDETDEAFHAAARSNARAD